jgi:predicted phage-related endonuclease
MHVTGLPRACVAVATITDDDELAALRLDWVESDPDLQQMLAHEADLIWAHVQAGTLPDPDCPSAAELVKQATAQADATAPVAALDDIELLVEELGRIRTAVKQVTDRQTELDAVVRHRMGAATRGRAGRWQISYSQPARVLTSLAEQAILLAHPELARPALDRDKAKQVLGKDLDNWKEPVGARRLTIKETTP